MNHKQENCDAKGNDKLPFFYAFLKQNAKNQIHYAACKQAGCFINMGVYQIKCV